MGRDEAERVELRRKGDTIEQYRGKFREAPSVTPQIIVVCMREKLA
jgi:hypothetical protein